MVNIPFFLFNKINRIESGSPLQTFYQVTLKDAYYRFLALSHSDGPKGSPFGIPYPLGALGLGAP